MTRKNTRGMNHARRLPSKKQLISSYSVKIRELEHLLKYHEELLMEVLTCCLGEEDSQNEEEQARRVKLAEQLQFTMDRVNEQYKMSTDRIDSTKN